MEAFRGLFLISIGLVFIIFGFLAESALLGLTIGSIGIFLGAVRLMYK